MELNRPNQKSQPSRKSKRAWRKNIDLEDVDQGLEEARELERVIGTKDLSSASHDVLFTIDTAGDETLKSKKDRVNLKPLKSDEILSRRSAIPGLKATHKKSSTDIDNKKKNGKVQGVSGKEINRLMRVAGRHGLDKSSALANLETDGLIKNTTDLYDAWGDNNTQNNNKTNKSSPPHITTSYKKPTVVPSTLNHPPVAPMPNSKPVEIPDEGRSYNPSIESWKDLLERENAREEVREKQRLATIEEKNRIEYLIATLNVKDVESDEDDDDNNDLEEGQDQESDVDDLSVNNPVQVKTKTRQQRNKQKRHLDRIKLQEQLKQLKQQLKDLENLPRLLKEEEARLAKELASASASTSTSTPDNSRGRKKKLGSQYEIMEAPLDIKLSDELVDCLRRLKPEGNLARDRFRSFQERGLIEARVPVSKKRKYSPKVTEKWSYKDIKL